MEEIEYYYKFKKKHSDRLLLFRNVDARRYVAYGEDAIQILQLCKSTRLR